MTDLLDGTLWRSEPDDGQWPPVPSPQGATLLAMLQQLERTQWFSAEKLAQLQWRQLKKIIEHGYANVPLYRERFSAFGRSFLRRLDEESFGMLPLLRRADVQQAGAALAASSVPSDQLPLGEVHTSGSTGMPIKAQTTARTRLFWNALTLRDHAWHRRDLGGKLAAIRFAPTGVAVFPAGAAYPNWGAPVSLALRSGPSALLNIRTEAAQQLEWLRVQQPDYLITYPSNARELGRLLGDRRTVLPGLKELRLFGEVVDDEVRSECVRAWDVRTTDAYSANEVGYIALQCPDGPHYHVQSESLLVEVLRDDGGPCAPGETGRVVLTTLHNLAMPLIRYNIGDYAEVGPPCPCGRGLPVLRRILGRTRNMLRLPTGEALWPVPGAAGFRERAPVRQYQVIQTTLTDLLLRLVVERPLTAEEEALLREKLVTSLGYPFRVSISYHAELERSPSLKFEEFKSLVDPV